MKLNNKGFTLVEILAVVVILGVLMAFMYPNVNKLINKNKEENLEKIKSTIESSTRLYISDYRYEISLGSDGTSIVKIGSKTLTNSRVLVSYLVEDGAIKVTDEGNIHNPKDESDCLNFDSSYVEVKYNSTIKDFEYSAPVLTWGASCK